MSLDDLKARLPEWARDAKLNLAIIGTSALEPRLAWGTAIAAAAAARHPELLAAVRAEAAPHVDAAHEKAALAAASVMAMNNVYYRFKHHVGADAPYAAMPARLRMQVIGNPGIDKLDFELACLAASAISGCESCVRSHEKAVRERGGTKEMVQDAVRIAAVMNGVAVALG